MYLLPTADTPKHCILVLLGHDPDPVACFADEGKAKAPPDPPTTPPGPGSAVSPPLGPSPSSTPGSLAFEELD